LLAKVPDPFVSKVGLTSRRVVLSPRSDKGIRSRTGWPPSAAGKGPGWLGWQRSGRAPMPMGPGASRQIVPTLILANRRRLAEGFNDF